MMKHSLLSFLVGAVVGTQALLNGLGILLLSPLHQALPGISAAYAEEAAAVKYTCPMHPQVVSDKPGKCPICGMDLVAIDSGHSHNEEATHSTAQTYSERKILYWYDPMKPETHFDKPGKSPFMDMELVPKYAEESDRQETGSKSVISIDAGTIQKMGVRTEKITRSMVGESLRATGIILPNERARIDLFSQVEGRVEGLTHSAPGDPVKKGELFYTLVSPDLIALQNDYIAALQGGLGDMAEAVRKRMKLLGIDDRVIATITKSRKPYDKVPFYIPATGILAKQEIRNGHYLKAGDEIGHIQDLSVVWVEASVAEKDVGAIKAGDTAKITFTGSNSDYTGKVDYIYPMVSAEARTAKVRLIVPNKDGMLRPDAYTTVTFISSTSERLTVPSEAILRDSSGDHVILALGDGKFLARTVKTGASSSGRTEIISGLQEGETVVTSSHFLIDSESNLRESMDKLQMPASPAMGGSHEGH
jgi:membrane fusion protein, copper/silver efflux system